MNDNVIIKTYANVVFQCQNFLSFHLSTGRKHFMTSLRCIQAARVTDLLFGAVIKQNNGYLQMRIVQW